MKLWMDKVYQKLNTNKTQLKFFKPETANISFELKFEDTILESTDEINLLGVRISNNLDLKQFVAKKVQACNFKLRNLSFIKDGLTFKTKILMVTNLILSNLDYCNSVLAGVPKKLIKPLQLILNRATRFIFNLTRRTHIKPFLKKLHFLPIQFRINFKLCLLAFKIYHGTAPEYLIMKFIKYIPTTTINLRIGPGRDTYMFQNNFPPHKKSTICDQIKQEWNSLPLYIRQINTINTFKSQLKAHFFTEAFHDVPSLT